MLIEISLCFVQGEKNLVTSSGEVADYNQLYTPPLILIFQACRRYYGCCYKYEKKSLSRANVGFVPSSLL